MSQSRHGSFGWLRDEIQRHAKSLRPEPAEYDEPAALLDLGRRLQRLQSLSAPARLREEALARALAAPIPSRTRVIPLRARPAELAVVVARLAASAVVAFGTAYGTVAVSAASLPNSPLYPVKIFVEDVRVAVTPHDQKPEIYVELAVRRVEETETLLQTNRIVDAERTIEGAGRMLAAARAAADQNPRTQPAREMLATTSERVQKTADAVTQRSGASPVIAPELGPSGRPSTDNAARVSPAANPSGPVGSDPLNPSIAQPPANPVVPIGPASEPAVGAPGASENAVVPGFELIESGAPARVQPTTAPAQVVAPVATFGPIEGSFRAAPTATRTPTPTETPVPRVSASPSPGSAVPAAPEGPFTIIPGRPSPPLPR